MEQRSRRDFGHKGSCPKRARRQWGGFWNNDAAHTVVDLGVLPGDIASSASFINNAGQIVGYSGTSVPNGQSRTFFYQNGTMVDPSSLVDTTSGTWEITGVMSLNNAGQMIAIGRHDGQLTSNILLTPMQ